MPSTLSDTPITDARTELSMPKLSFWMAGAENTKLGRTARAWFSLLGRAAFWGPQSQNPLTCGEAALELIAWQRGVKRYPGEPERLYRLRVNYAYHNARDAGSVSGWTRIFHRLELLQPDELELLERMEKQDWDIVGILLSDERQSELQDCIERIMIEEYGRTCRRYHLVSRITEGVRIGAAIFDDDHTTVQALSGAFAAHRLGVVEVS